MRSLCGNIPPSSFYILRVFILIFQLLSHCQLVPLHPLAAVDVPRPPTVEEGEPMYVQRYFIFVEIFWQYLSSQGTVVFAARHWTGLDLRGVTTWGTDTMTSTRNLFSASKTKIINLRFRYYLLHSWNRLQCCACGKQMTMDETVLRHTHWLVLVLVLNLNFPSKY